MIGKLKHRSKQRFTFDWVGIFLMLIIGLSIGCASDKKSDLELIQGTWKLKEAQRNEKSTRSLDGMYLQFDGNQSFESNILGDSTSYAFEIQKRKILVDHSLISTFKILEISDSLLKLTTKINEDEIQLVFNK